MYSKSFRRFTFEDHENLSTTPNEHGEFISTKTGRVLAKRIVVDLKRENVLTYINDELLYAVDWMEDYPEFALDLYDKDGNKLPFKYCGAQLQAYSGAITCEFVPVSEPAQVSFVKWVGNTLGDKTVKADGSVQMDPDYRPTEGQDVATKNYIDNIFNNGAEVDRLIETIDVRVYQDGRTEQLGAIYKPLEEERIPMFFLKDGNISIETEPFVIPFDLSKASLGVYIDGVMTYITDTLDNIEPMTESDLYAGMPFGRGQFTLRSYDIHTQANKLRVSSDYSVPHKLVVALIKRNFNQLEVVGLSKAYTYYLCSGSSQIRADSTEFGYSKSEEPVRMAYDKKLSGITDCISTAKKVLIPVSVSVPKSRFVDDYLPDVPFVSAVINGQKSWFDSTDFTDEGDTYKVSSTVELDLAQLKADNYHAQKIAYGIIVDIFDYQGNLIVRRKLDCEPVIIDYDSDESLRVATPNADVVYPIEFGKRYEQVPEGMVIFNNIYKATKDESTLMICLPNEEGKSFSHAIIEVDEIKGNGDIQVKAEGSCGWLNASKEFSGIGTPEKDGDACHVTKNGTSTKLYVTFGKKCYNKKLYVRFLRFLEIKNLKVTIG